MAKFDFAVHFAGGDVDELEVQRERQLRLLIEEMVQAAVAAGWDRPDFLLSLVELSWSLYECAEASGDKKRPY